MTLPIPTVQLDLLKALVSLLGNLPDVNVSFGEPRALQSGDTLAVGVTDPEAAGKSSAASSTITWGTSMTEDGYAESGEVMLAAVSTSGGNDLTEVADRVYRILGEVVAAIRSNYAATNGQNLLGVAGLWELRLSAVDLPVLAPGEYGATAYLLFRLAYQALT